LLGLLSFAAGCDLTPIVCTDHVQPGIVVTIVDSVTGDPRAAQSSGVAQEGSFTDSLRPLGFDGQPPVMVSRHAADERAGIYRVTVHAPGYRDWERSGLRVSSGDCHVQTRAVIARLQAP
jgi:hypothetical protein